MEKVISCCGVVCTDCAYYPEDCKGCPEIEGNAFWLEYTGGSICEIYQCCINDKKRKHCGDCPSLPCRFYTDANDPTKSEEENRQILESQLQQLKGLLDR